jgi:hypothetical protein
MVGRAYIVVLSGVTNANTLIHLPVRCDIGGVNNSTHFAAKFFNEAANRNREVTINDRCGIRSKDFTTPEYSTLASTSRE